MEKKNKDKKKTGAEKTAVPGKAPVKPVKPVAKPEAPVAKIKPAVKPVKPVAKPEAPVAKVKPAVKPVKPVAKPETPVAKVKPAVKPVKPVAKPETPVTKVKPAVKRVAKPKLKPKEIVVVKPPVEKVRTVKTVGEIKPPAVERPAPPPPTSPPSPPPSPPPIPEPHAPLPKVPVIDKKIILPKIKINELSTIREIAGKINKSPSDLLKKLLGMGIVSTINQRLDRDTASVLLHEYDYDIDFINIYEEEISAKSEDKKLLKPRPPVVTVMGHVDHGKTTLLDTIRKSKITEKEHGGITQHIGAYMVKTPKGEIVFLDTPGHQAFTAMRAHGSKITDIVVLVVAADDNVMPQTVEAIDHARAAGVPIIVAINKIDVATANPQGTKQKLTQYGLIPDDWGGDTLTVEISARNNINIDKLLESILFKAELMELKANPERPARGVVVESRMDPRKGPVATVLVQAGTLKAGDALICGFTGGKVRAMLNDTGHRINAAGPSVPVEILGLESVVSAGDACFVVKDERLAREIISKRKAALSAQRVDARKRVSLEDIGAGRVKQLDIILKTDVSGSLDAIKDAIEHLHSDEIKLNIVHGGVGAINESDVNLAIASNAIIIGFNVRANPNAETMAKKEGIDTRTYRIIYELISSLKSAMEGLVEPKMVETTTGRVEIKKVFQITGSGAVAGCMVIDGKINRSSKVRLLRDDVIVYEGTIKSLKRFKDDVREVEKGYECGVSLENYNDIKAGDIIEVYVQEKAKAI